jgi:hypothetical protein
MNMDNVATREAMEIIARLWVGSHFEVREALLAGDESGASVLAHLRVCGDCARLAEEVDRRQELTGSVVVPPPSAGLQERVLHNILRDYDDHNASREAIEIIAQLWVGSHFEVREALLAGDENGVSLLAHLQVCADCAHLAEEVDRLEELTGSVVVPPPSAGLKAQVLGSVLAHYDRHVAAREAIVAGEKDASVLTHLEVCEDCARLAEEVDRIDELGGSVIVPPPSAGLKAQILGSLLAHYDRHIEVREALFAGESSASVLAHLKVCADCARLAEEVDSVDQPSGSVGVSPPCAGLQAPSPILAPRMGHLISGLPFATENNKEGRKTVSRRFIAELALVVVAFTIAVASVFNWNHGTTRQDAAIESNQRCQASRPIVISDGTPHPACPISTKVSLDQAVEDALNSVNSSWGDAGYRIYSSHLMTVHGGQLVIWELTFKASGLDGEATNPNATVWVDAKTPGKVLAQWRPGISNCAPPPASSQPATPSDTSPRGSA